MNSSLSRVPVAQQQRGKYAVRCDRLQIVAMLGRRQKMTAGPVAAVAGRQRIPGDDLVLLDKEVGVAFQQRGADGDEQRAQGQVERAV